ncbi:type I DNA topoisomerase [Patescibacteria group bacterium]
MKLVIVESPAKTKSVGKYLGSEYTVTSSVGHIRDLPKSNKAAIDIEAGFVPHYEVSKGKEKVVAEIKRLAKKADEIYLATDPDREGEAIAYHVAEVAGAKNPKRIAFNEITESAVQEAIKHPREIDQNLLKAQEARRVLDRLFGYDLSGLIWKKVRYGLSAGRVQSPALRILMEREREIRAFDPVTYWTINAEVKKDKIEFPLVCAEEPREKKEMERILEEGKKGEWSVMDVKESEQKRSPKPPFTTSTLQQAASTRLGFAPSRTMGVAQKLYEAGHITYMRTDSTTLSKDAEKQIVSFVQSEYGKEYTAPRTYKTKSKTAQEAHEAVRPSNIKKESAGMNEDQKKLYRLIWARTVASQMSDAKLLKTKVVANIKEESIPNFSINGSRVIYDGWLKADPEARGEDTEVPKVAKGDTLNLIDISSEEKETAPPGRYTEAGLIKELEKRGIGRPSTYASTIKTVVDRGYVEKQGRTLFPTDTGDVVSSFLEEHFAKYISDSFTAEMEDELDDIANGDREYVKTLKDFYTPFTKDVASKESMEKITNMGEADPKYKCPECDGKMVIKLSKAGKFMSCAKFPECTGARTIEGEELEGPKKIGKKCPKCGDPKQSTRKNAKKKIPGELVERDGRFGRFISCSNYPKCKYIEESAEEVAKKNTGVKCTECKDGEMIERTGRFGIFYSCSNYPECKHAIKAKPTGNKCKMCDKLMMEGTKTIPERCSDKACPNHRPDKLDKK